jgi:hypothetical protein
MSGGGQFSCLRKVTNSSQMGNAENAKRDSTFRELEKAAVCLQR